MSIIRNGLSGALAAQAALDATSQNVANAMTPGYTRQGVLLKSLQPLRGGAISAGAGVAVSTLLRFSDGYKSQQMWSASSELGLYSTAQTYLTQLEQVLGDEESGINVGLDAFFAALNAASVEPTSSPLRQQVITTADALAQRINSASRVLLNQRISVAQQRGTIAGQVNTLASEIAQLNEKIVETRNGGVNPSGLLDERDRKIDELADLVALQVAEQPDGSLSVSLRSGQPMVVGARAGELKVQDNADGSQTITLDFALESFTLAADRIGGQLGGLNAFDNDVLGPLMASISDMAQQLTDNVNAQLADGFDLNGQPGEPLFQYNASGITGVLSINKNLMPADLAFSSNPGEQGASDNLLALIALRSQPVNLPSLGAVSLSDAVTQLVARLGMVSQQNQAGLSTAQTVRNQAEENWKSTSGVNMDEEAVNLMQYQQMYQANMRVVAVANELFESTMAMLR